MIINQNSIGRFTINNMTVVILKTKYGFTVSVNNKYGGTPHSFRKDHDNYLDAHRTFNNRINDVLNNEHRNYSDCDRVIVG